MATIRLDRLEEKGIKPVIGDAIDAKAVEAVLTSAGKKADIISTSRWPKRA